MKKFLLIICFTSTFISYSNTGKYRLVITDNPATTIMIAWEQISGTNPIIYFDTLDHGTAWNNYSFQKSIDRSVYYKGMNNTFSKLTGLTPNTSYYFVIKDSEGISERFWFKTTPDTNETMQFISGGDSRNNRGTRQNANKLVAKLKPIAIFFGGDMTNGDSSSEWKNWLDDWQLTTASDGRMFPIIPTRGNHESSNLSIYEIFNTPSENIYYKIIFGENLLSIYTLNSEITAGGIQGEWLENELINDNSNWKTAQYHKPMRPHVSSKMEGNDEYVNWSKLFFDYKVKLVFESDSHTVKTTWPIKPCINCENCESGFVRDDDFGTIYVGEGCWGAPLRENDDSKIWTRDYGSFNQFKWVCVSTGQIDLKTIVIGDSENVLENSNNSSCSLPVGLNLWTPTNGDTVTILNTSLELPRVEFSSLSDNDYIENGTNILIDATATDDDGTISHLEFYINGNLEHTDYSEPFQFNHNFSNGGYIIEAIAYDNDNFSSNEIIKVYVGNYSDSLNQSLDDLKLSPNPFKNIITFSNLSSDFTSALFKIYNLNGKLVYSKRLNCKTINLNFLTNGIYIIKLESQSNKILTRKIVKN